MNEILYSLTVGVAGGWLLAGAFITMLLLPLAFEQARKLGGSYETAVWYTWAAVSFFCFAAGLALVGDWHNPLANAEPATVARVAAKGKGGGGLILLTIAFWPYVLMGLGGYFGGNAVYILRKRAERK